MRDLIFVIWLKAGKDVDKTLELVEQLSIAQFEPVSKGGARMVQATVSGKTFQYELPQGWSSGDFIGNLRLAYKKLKTGGTSGAAMTEAQIETFVQDTDDEVANVTRARFGEYTGGRYGY